MAFPIIDSITVAPPEIKECEAAIVTFIAHDPTPGTPPRDVTLELRVTNALGEVTPGAVTVHLVGSDPGPLTYSLTVPEGEKGQVFQDPVQLNVFTYVAPCPLDPNHDPITHITEALPHTH